MRIAILGKFWEVHAHIKIKPPQIKFGSCTDGPARVPWFSADIIANAPESPATLTAEQLADR